MLTKKGLKVLLGFPIAYISPVNGGEGDGAGTGVGGLSKGFT